GKEWHVLGTWGPGVISPEFEVEPPEHLKDLLPLRNLNRASWTNIMPPHVEATPWGAGLCVRRRVAEAYFDLTHASRIPITGLNGKVLHGGEDDELSYTACKLGLGVATFPNLRLIHIIPEERISEAYLIKLLEGTHFSKTLLAYKWFGTKPSPFSI